MYEDYLYTRKQEQIQSVKKVDVINDNPKSDENINCTDDNVTETQRPIEPNKTDITVPNGDETKNQKPPTDNMPIPAQNPVSVSPQYLAKTLSPQDTLKKAEQAHKLSKLLNEKK